MIVLVVEDDKSNLEMLHHFVTAECEIACIKASNVKEALMQMEKYKPKCILLDYWLGDEFADEVVYKAREWFPDNPPEIVLVSAVAKLDQIAGRLHLKHYIRKPYDIETITEILELIGCFKKKENNKKEG